MDKLSKSDYDFEVLFLDDQEDQKVEFTETAGFYIATFSDRDKFNILIGFLFFVNFIVLSFVYGTGLGKWSCGHLGA